jgi:hypothetical protein
MPLSEWPCNGATASDTSTIVRRECGRSVQWGSRTQPALLVYYADSKENREHKQMENIFGDGN